MLPFSGLTLQGGVVQLVADLGFDANYTSTDAVNPIAQITVTIKRDGTWAVTGGSGDVLTGTASGTWAASPNATVGDSAFVKFSDTNEVGTPTITNGASDYTQINADITFVISKPTTLASCDLTISITSGGATTTDTANLSVDGT